LEKTEQRNEGGRETPLVGWMRSIGKATCVDGTYFLVGESLVVPAVTVLGGEVVNVVLGVLNGYLAALVACVVRLGGVEAGDGSHF
jgi:hypothetical protein